MTDITSIIGAMLPNSGVVTVEVWLELVAVPDAGPAAGVGDEELVELSRPRSAAGLSVGTPRSLELSLVCANASPVPAAHETTAASKAMELE